MTPPDLVIAFAPIYFLLPAALIIVAVDFAKDLMR